MVSRTRDNPTLALTWPTFSVGPWSIHFFSFGVFTYLVHVATSEVTHLYFLTKSIRRNNWFEPNLGLCGVGKFGLNVVQKLEKLGRLFSCLVLCIPLLTIPVGGFRAVDPWDSLRAPSFSPPFFPILCLNCHTMSSRSLLSAVDPEAFEPFCRPIFLFGITARL